MLLSENETTDNSKTLDLPEHRLREDALETSRAASESQPEAMEKENLTLQTRVTQLEAELALAQACIQDLRKIESFLR